MWKTYVIFLDCGILSKAMSRSQGKSMYLFHFVSFLFYFNFCFILFFSLVLRSSKWNYFKLQCMYNFLVAFFFNFQFNAFYFDILLKFLKWRNNWRAYFSTCVSVILFSMCLCLSISSLSICIHIYLSKYINIIYLKMSKRYHSCWFAMQRKIYICFCCFVVLFWPVNAVGILNLCVTKIIQILSLYFHKILDVKCDMLFSFLFHWNDENVHINMYLCVRFDLVWCNQEQSWWFVIFIWVVIRKYIHMENTDDMNRQWKIVETKKQHKTAIASEQQQWHQSHVKVANHSYTEKTNLIRYVKRYFIIFYMLQHFDIF